MFPLLLLLILVAAAPRSLHPRQQQPNDDRRATSFSPQIWLPVVGVVVFIFILAIFSWSNKRIRARIGRSVNASNNVSQGPRELTAEQLAGTINGNANGALPRTRRARRPRRTPSQMSVTSLPAYNKEPGDLELVIIRGADAEDADAEARQITARVATSEEAGDNSRPGSPLRNDYPAESQQPNSTSAETTGLLTRQTDEPRGEAPPYFEVVDITDAPLPSSPPLPPPAVTSPPTSDTNTTTSGSPPNSPDNRRSTIRTFFNRMSTVGAPRGFTHVRGASSLSEQSHPPSSASPAASPSTSSIISPTSPSRHRATPSSTSSFFRTISRQKSQSTLNGNRSTTSLGLTSPSLISLNSISAPLTHTAIRTEFTYPKSGPTPEQLKVISSRENVARFGVPYGADAIAFASSSRLNLDDGLPPPDFETIAGRSRNVNASSTSLHVRGDSSGGRAPSPLIQLASPTQEPEPTPSSSAPSSSAAAEQSISDKYKVLPFPASTIPSNTSASPLSQSNSAPPTLTVSEFGAKLAPSSFTKSNSGTVKSTNTTASDYSTASEATSRSESRTSMRSYASFETAAESIRPAETPTTANSTRAGSILARRQQRQSAGEADDSSSSDEEDEDDGPGTPTGNQTLTAIRPEDLDAHLTAASGEGGNSSVSGKGLGHQKDATDATIVNVNSKVGSISSVRNRDTIIASSSSGSAGVAP